MKKRILALLLAVLLVAGLLPGSVFADLTGGNDPYSVEDDTEIISGIGGEDDSYSVGDDTEIIPGIGGEDDSYSVGDDTEIIPGIGDEDDSYSVGGDTEITPGIGGGEDCNCGLPGGTHAATCPNYVCPNCGGQGWHEVCPEETPSGYDADIGKYVQFVEAVGSYFVYESADSYDAIYFYYSDFEEGTILRITDWCVDEISGLRYRVEFYSGGIVEEYADLWPAEAWVLQNYLEDGWETDSLEFVSIACDICGEEGCTIRHTYCGTCGALDCTVEHIYCFICKGFDCGIEHEPPVEEDHTPPTAPVIPENPQLPGEYDVAIVDENGDPVTGEDGFLLGWNEKASLSAWSALGEEVSYQWQILVDDGGELWVDITGQTEKGLLFSRAMLTSAMDADGCAWLRCVTATENTTLTGDPIPVTVMQEGSEENGASLLGMRSFALSSRSIQDSGIALASDEPEYVSITIKYLTAESFVTDAEEESVHAAYVASIPWGEDFSQTIVAPTITGYAPFWDVDGDRMLWTGEDFYDSTTGTFVEGDNPGVDESAAEITLNLDTVTENKVFYVYYLPIKVNIGVRYYFQNLNNDYYTEDVSRYHAGKMRTGTTVTEEYLVAHAGDISGFEKMYHQPATVAADGSTVFECYYDRNYYLINFSLGGGYGVEPIYARYEAPVMVGTPVRAGYKFMGWDLFDTDTDSDGTMDTGDNTADTLPSTVPAGNRIYGAIWEPDGDVPYTLAYWIIDNESDTNTFIGSVVNSALADTEIVGVNFPLNNSTPLCGLEAHTHSDECNENGCGKLEHAHDTSCPTFDTTHLVLVGGDTELVNGDGTTVVNVYYTYQKYTLRFYYARTSNNGAEVVGGTVYPFGVYGGNRADTPVDTLLSNVTEWGKVTGLNGSQDDFNDTGKERVKTPENPNGAYTVATTTVGNYTYYYLQFTVPYGACLEDLWPIDIFAPVQVNEKHAAHGGTDDDFCPIDNAYFSAWCGEYKVKYSQDNANQTIKGLYMYLDDEILYKTGTYTVLDDGSRLVNYLGFWDNGDNIGWSRPKLFRYQLWVQPAPGQTGTTYGEFMGNNSVDYASYILYRAFNTYDNSEPSEQTPSALKGYTYKARTSTNLTSKEAILPYVNDATIATDLSKNPPSHVVNFFYSSETYALTVNNRGTTIASKPDVAFETSLKSLMDEFNEQNGGSLFTGDNYTPPYPGSLEAGGYSFKGWYSTAAFVDETEVDIASDKMPAGNLAIYAKWSPVPRYVNFFCHYEYLMAFENGQKTIEYDGQTYEIADGMQTVQGEHGAALKNEDVPEYVYPFPTGEGVEMKFIGWFYFEDGQKKAYSPTNIPLREDLNVYAEWRDKNTEPYRISYVLKDTETKIAEDTFGYSAAGLTRTFVAKAGYPSNELYDLSAGGGENYNEGYFPLTASHSIVVKPEDDLHWMDPQNNVYSFEYVKAEHVKYTVRHIAVEGNVETLIEEEEKYTNNAIVTEKFMDLTGTQYAEFVADAFYKELIIAVVEDPDKPGSYIGAPSNVITFYYTASGDALYAIHHMVEKLHSAEVYADPDQLDAMRDQYYIDGTGGYENYGHRIEQLAPAGSPVIITPVEISGFTRDKTHVRYFEGGDDMGLLPADGEKYQIIAHKAGSEVYFFYQRNDYDYTVHYYKFNTKEEVDPGNLPYVIDSAPYGSTVSVTAPRYTEDKSFVLVSEQTQSIQIRQEESQNEIIFYYSPIQYKVEYIAVPEEGGTLSVTTEVRGSEEFTGSTATANKNYEFVGWFTDPALTNEVAVGTTAEVYKVATGQFIPKRRMDGEGNPITDYVFYAKFNLLAADFTITRENAEPGQVFVYRVEGNGLTIDVTIRANESGNGSVTIADLPFGDYTVTQLNDWSWRYSDDAKAVTHDAENTDGVTFSGLATAQKWLNGNSDRIQNKRKEDE